MHTQHDSQTIDRNRLKATLAVRNLSPTALAAALGISQRHLELVAKGDRAPSRAMSEGLQRVLGAEAWAFVVGETDTLNAAAVQDAA